MGFQQDIVALREQIKGGRSLLTKLRHLAYALAENALILFPKVGEEHHNTHTTPIKESDAFNIQLIRIKYDGYKALLTCRVDQRVEIAAVDQLTAYTNEALRALLDVLSKSLFVHLGIVKKDDLETLSMLRAQTGDWVNYSRN